jgi:hypothetical protein
MQVRWYYQKQEGVIGPVSEAELRYLVNVGTLGMSTLVRRGDDGPWLAAESIGGQIGLIGAPKNADDSAPEVPDWHFNLKGQAKQGPVLGSVLKNLFAEGKLQPDDLVWKPGMAMWVPASQVRGLLEEPARAVASEARFLDRFAVTVRTRVGLIGVAMMMLIGLAAALIGWVRTKAIDQPGLQHSRSVRWPRTDDLRARAESSNNCSTTHELPCDSTSLTGLHD